MLHQEELIMEENIRLFADCRCELSESPMRNKEGEFLYWHGFHGELYRKKINDDVNDFECFQLNIGRIGSMVFTNSNYMLLFADGGKDKSFMFVTTAGDGTPSDEHNGRVFMVKDIAVGAEEFVLKGM